MAPPFKKGGFFVVSEYTLTNADPPIESLKILKELYSELKNHGENIKIIKKAIYKLLTHFDLPISAWELYFGPIEERITNLKNKYQDNEEVLKVLEEELHEMEIIRNTVDICNYVFYIMQK